MRGAICAGLLLCALPFSGGCHLYRYAVKNGYYELELYHSVEERRREIKQEARDVLKEICDRHKHRKFRDDFKVGFVDGYWDFMERGPPARPPAEPPPRYRTAKYLTPEGICCVRDYFAGFQYGAECAEATGHRQYYTVPVLVSPTQPIPPLNISTLPTPPDGGIHDTLPPGEPLPTPRTVETIPSTLPGTVPGTTTPPMVKPAIVPKPETPSTAPKVVVPKSDVPPVVQPIPQPMPRTQAPPTIAPRGPVVAIPTSIPSTPPATAEPKVPPANELPPLPSVPVPSMPSAATTPTPTIPLLPTLPPVSVGK